MENDYQQPVSPLRNEFEQKRTRRYVTTRAIMDFGMGILYVAVGLFIIFSERIELFDNLFRYIFGGLCAVYGAWRIYRGFKKDYY